MKTLKFTLAAVAVASLVGCSSSEPVEQASVPDCTFPAPDNKEAAPMWVCTGAWPDYDLTAVGFSDKSAAGTSFMREQAILAARQELASILSTRIESSIKNFVETTGKGDSETVDAVASSVKKQITATTLVGSKPLIQTSTPSQGLAVLVGLDPETAANVATQALKASMNNEKALWQKFQSDKAFEELANDIANMNAN